MKSEYRRLAMTGKLDCTSCKYKNKFDYCTYPHSEMVSKTVGEGKWCVYYAPNEEKQDE